MEEVMNQQLDYGNWIRKKNLVYLGSCALGIGILLFLPFGTLYRLLLSILFVVVFFSFLFPLYAYIMFSQKGGGLQEKIYDLIIRSLGEDVKGKILDIGSGNGVLAIKLARRHDKAEVIGVDSWGKDWEYSKGVCEKNAQILQVAGRVLFQNGNAAALNFPANTFDGAVSNLTFHEVKPVDDKREVVREALRILKPGGAFAFIDYFYDPKYYANSQQFNEFLRDMKLSQFECKPLREVMSLPPLLRHPRILGRVGIIWGRK